MAEERIVRVADLQVARDGDTLITLGLGSCVAIMLHDGEARIGGMAHVLLPSRSLSRMVDNPGRYPESAVPELVRSLVAFGADPRRLTARLAGGASMFASLVPAGSIHMGERNVIASREALGRQGIPVRAEAVGGVQGRSVWFTPGDGVVRVRVVGHAEFQL
jgi:chemotaxis protein CheD